MNRFHHLFILCIMTILIGCATIRDAQKPLELNLPDTWHSISGDNIKVQDAMPDGASYWWSIFNDVTLNNLIDTALKENLTIKEAKARLTGARALVGAGRADIYPEVSFSGNVSRSGSGSGAISNLFQTGFDANWELDIFGGKRYEIEAREAELESTVEDIKATIVSLQAEVALNYIKLRMNQKRLELLRKNMSILKENHELILSRYNSGISDALEVEQSRTTLEMAMAQISAIEEAIEGSLNRLSILLGKKPGELHSQLQNSASLPEPPHGVVIGIPAETILQRPDVRRAERLFASKSAKVDVAKAELYPKIALTGSIGLEAISTADLFKWASRVWRIASPISWKVFDAGLIRKGIEVAEARKEEALYQYYSVLLEAIEEVENSIVAYTKELQRMEHLRTASLSAEESNSLARNRYEAGITDFINLLDAERSLLGIQDELIQSNGKALTNLISLYKALGGGWRYYNLN